MNVYRVTVRGQFVGLTDNARRYLKASAADHDIFLSAFTEEGTFTYDERLQFFNLRYEVRIDQSAASSLLGTTTATPESVALEEARMFLKTMGIGHGPLRAATMDMTEMAARNPGKPSSVD